MARSAMSRSRGLFLGGIVPGLHGRLRPDDLLLFLRAGGLSQKPRASFGQLAEAAKAARAADDDPGHPLGGILTGWFTPTEAGIIAIVYILVVVMPLLNRGHFRHLPRDFVYAGLLYSLPLTLIGAASAFGWMLAYLRGPISSSAGSPPVAGNDPLMIMFRWWLLFTIVGDFIEPCRASSSSCRSSSS